MKQNGNQVFEVQIFYREPLCRRWPGGGPFPPYVARYRRIPARDRSEAAGIARGRFDDLSRNGVVTRRPQVVEIRVQPRAF